MILILERRFMEKYSKQREEIINLLSNCRTHPTAEEIYLMLKENGSTASRGTVYRNLNVLLENKTIKKIKVLTGPDKYDYIDKEHYHVICNKCGKVFDFMYQFKKEKLKELIHNQTSVITNVDSIILYGICEECKSKIKYEEE